MLLFRSLTLILKKIFTLFFGPIKKRLFEIALSPHIGHAYFRNELFTYSLNNDN